MAIDTHKAFEALTGAGADPRLAEEIVRLHREADERAATKQDLQSTEEALREDLQALRGNLRSTEESLKQDLQNMEKATKQDMALLEQKLIAAMNRRAFALLVALLGGVWGLLEVYL